MERARERQSVVGEEERASKGEKKTDAETKRETKKCKRRKR